MEVDNINNNNNISTNNTMPNISYVPPEKITRINLDMDMKDEDNNYDSRNTAPLGGNRSSEYEETKTNPRGFFADTKTAVSAKFTHIFV